MGRASTYTWGKRWTCVQLQESGGQVVNNSWQPHNTQRDSQVKKNSTFKPNGYIKPDLIMYKSDPRPFWRYAICDAIYTCS